MHPMDCPHKFSNPEKLKKLHVISASKSHAQQAASHKKRSICKKGRYFYLLQLCELIGTD